MQTAGTAAKWQSTANLHTTGLGRRGGGQTVPGVAQPWVKPTRVLSLNLFEAFGCLIVVGWILFFDSNISNIMQHTYCLCFKPHVSPQVLAWHGSGSRSSSNSCSNWNKACSVRSLFSLLWPRSWSWSWSRLLFCSKSVLSIVTSISLMCDNIDRYKNIFLYIYIYIYVYMNNKYSSKCTVVSSLLIITDDDDDDDDDVDGDCQVSRMTLSPCFLRDIHTKCPRFRTIPSIEASFSCFFKYIYICRGAA